MALTPALLVGARPRWAPVARRRPLSTLNWRSALAAGDLAVALVAGLPTWAFQATLDPDGDSSAIWLITLVLFAIGSLRLVDTYDRIHRARPRNALRRVAFASAADLGLCILVAGVSSWRTAVVGVVVVGALVAWRVLACALGARPSSRTRVLLVTRRRLDRHLRMLVREAVRTGYDVVEVLDLNRVASGTPDLADMLVRCVERQAARLIITDAPKHPESELQTALDELTTRGISVTSAADVYQSLTGRALLGRQALLPRTATWGPYGLITRAADVAFASLGLAVAAPFLLVVAAAIVLDSPGRPLYRQARVGRHGKCFQMLKLRTMRADAEAGDCAVWASQADPRVTRVGRWLRRCHMDELPQLWNVVRGDMGLIGPRPERPEFVQLFATRVPHYATRHAVRPGITGWAQVKFKYAASVRETTTKLQYDLYYINHRSFVLDLVIILKTVFVILRLQGV